MGAQQLVRSGRIGPRNADLRPMAPSSVKNLLQGAQDLDLSPGLGSWSTRGVWLVTLQDLLRSCLLAREMNGVGVARTATFC